MKFVYHEGVAAGWVNDEVARPIAWSDFHKRLRGWQQLPVSIIEAKNHDFVGTEIA